ncbi:TetR/AcrR family transcriptional regulator [Adhaeribacter arboris]|nr:TetR/AcrR family transcriptional regulator [Adhaeribacter arboris]
MPDVTEMEIKDKILQAAFRLFMRNGIKSVSMDDIALNLGVSKKTLYKWFENKDQLVMAMLQDHLDKMVDDCGSFTMQAKNAIEELFQMMQMIRQQLAGMHPSVFYDLQKYHQPAWQIWITHKNKFILQQIARNLKDGVKQGLYRTDFDLDIMARLRLAQIEDVFNPEIFPPDKFDLQKVQLATLEHFMLGIASLKGHKLINAYKQVVEQD